MKHSTETRWQMFYQCQREEEAHRKMEKKVLLVACLFLLFVGMGVAALGQDTSEFWSFREEIPIPMNGELPLHEIAKRYGVVVAVQLQEELNRAEEARREMAKIKAAQWRDRELRKKVTELANASLKLYQRFKEALASSVTFLRSSRTRREFPSACSLTEPTSTLSSRTEM